MAGGQQLSEALGTALAQAEMVPLLELLCRDSVAAIRQKAATQVAGTGLSARNSARCGRERLI